MKIAVFGGTGYVGSYLVKSIIAIGHTPVVMVRKGSEAKLVDAGECHIVSGNISDEYAIKNTLEDCQIAIYAIGIIREQPNKGIFFEDLHYRFARQCMKFALESKIKRFIYISANNAERQVTQYLRTKYRAEQFLISSGLEYSIFRPSIIYGKPISGYDFFTQIKRDIVYQPFPAPAFFSGLKLRSAGKFSFSTVHARDLGSTIIRSISFPEFADRIIYMGSTRSITWNEIIDLISKVTDRKKWILPVPVGPIRLASKIFDRFAWFPVTSDQLKMLMEGNECDSNEVFHCMKIDPIEISEESLRYLARD
jgi:NADH dehydrogenase